jgi:hypothetical protein
MNKQNRHVPIDFAPEERFPVKPVTAAPFRAAEFDGLEQLKDRLLRQLLNETAEAELCSPLRGAANDAASLAWATGYPLLFFPMLLEEKVQTARRQAGRQKHIRRRSRPLVERVA